jgi:hypothetical protein
MVSTGKRYGERGAQGFRNLGHFQRLRDFGHQNLELSSPPRRHAVPMARARSTKRFATDCSNWSPIADPCESLMRLK